MASQGFEVAVRGAGAVGMALALTLARQGLRVALLGGARPAPGGPTPAAASPRADVRTWALNAASESLLRQIKVWDALPADACTAVQDMRVRGDGDAVLHFSAWQQGVTALAWIVDAAELEQALRSAVGFAPHIQALPADAAVEAELLVVTEGRHASSRAALGVSMPLHSDGQVAVAARLSASKAHEGLARQWFRQPEVLALLPFSRPAQNQSYGLVWSMPQERAQAMMGLDAEAFCQALHDALGEDLASVGTLRLEGERAAWPLLSGQASPLCGRGWTLAGDAAHVVHPLAGQGLNLGLADVQALADTLAARESFRRLGDEKLLRRYARSRTLPTRAMGLVTEGLWQLFAEPNPLARGLRNAGMNLLDQVSPIKRWMVARAMNS